MNMCCGYEDRGLRQTLVKIVATLTQGLSPEENGEYLQMMLTVKHPFQEKFLLTIESSLLKEITGKIYGYDEQQLACERRSMYLNMLASRFLRIIMPPRSEYELGLLALVEASAILIDETCINFVSHSKDRRLVFSITSP